MVLIILVMYAKSISSFLLMFVRFLFILSAFFMNISILASLRFMVLFNAIK